MTENTNPPQQVLLLHGCCIPRNAAELLHSFPEWHKAYFEMWDQLDIGKDGYPLWGYILEALQNISDEMSITDVCLLIFPLPNLEKYRSEFAQVILGESFYCELPLSENVNDWDISTGWNCWRHVAIKLEKLESHTLKSKELMIDGNEYGYFVHIWRRHLEERKAGVPFGGRLEDHIRSDRLTVEQLRIYPKLTRHAKNLKRQMLHEIRIQRLDQKYINKEQFLKDFVIAYRVVGVTIGMAREAWKQLSIEGKVSAIPIIEK